MKLYRFLVEYTDGRYVDVRSIRVTAQSALEAIKLVNAFYAKRGLHIEAVGARRESKQCYSKNAWEYVTGVDYYERELIACGLMEERED